MKRRILSLFIVLCMTVSMLTVATTFADEEEIILLDYYSEEETSYIEEETFNSYEEIQETETEGTVAETDLIEPALVEEEIETTEIILLEEEETEEEIPEETATDDTEEESPDEVHFIDIIVIPDIEDVDIKSYTVEAKSGDVITLENAMYGSYFSDETYTVLPQLLFSYNGEEGEYTEFTLDGYSLEFTLDASYVENITITIEDDETLLYAYPSSWESNWGYNGTTNTLVGISSKYDIHKTGMDAWWPNSGNHTITRSSDWSYFYTYTEADLMPGDVVLFATDAGYYTKHMDIVEYITPEKTEILYTNSSMAYNVSTYSKPLLVWRNNATFKVNGITMRVGNAIGAHARNMMFWISRRGYNYLDGARFSCYERVCDLITTTVADAELKINVIDVYTMVGTDWIPVFDIPGLINHESASPTGAVFQLFDTNNKALNVWLIADNDGNTYKCLRYKNKDYDISGNYESKENYPDCDFYTNVTVKNKNGSLVGNYEFAQLSGGYWYCKTSEDSVKVATGHYYIKNTVISAAPNYSLTDTALLFGVDNTLAIEPLNSSQQTTDNVIYYRLNGVTEAYYFYFEKDELVVGDTTEVRVLPINRYGKNVPNEINKNLGYASDYKTDNPDIIQVERSVASCKVTALKPGTATIRALEGCVNPIETKVTVYFSDILSLSKSFKNAIMWANEKGIVNGYSNGKFGEADSCTRKQFVIMLYRLAGKPAVSGTMKFPDCQEYSSTSDTYKAILWASQKGIINGYSNGNFGPNDTVTRQQVMIMLYKYAGKPKVSGTLPFNDVAAEPGSNIYNAILWGVSNGITNGTSSTTFSPNSNCLRRQIAMFLYKYAK